MVSGINSYGTTPAQLPDVPNTGSLAGTGATGQVNDAKLDEELLSLVAQSNGGQGGKDGVTDARGAPMIAPPAQKFNADDLIDLLRDLRSKNQDVQMKTAEKNVEASRIKAEKNTEAQLQKIKEWIDKAKEEESKGFLGKIFGWIGKIVAAIAAFASVAIAAVATVATGGAAAPLLALAIVGAVGATMSLADQISKECGGPEISISNLLNVTVGKLLEAAGVPKEKAEQITKIIGGAIGLMAPVTLMVEPQLLGNMALGIAKMAGLDDEKAGYIAMAISLTAAFTVGIGMAVASGGSSLGSSALKIANSVVGAAGQITQGITGATQGGLNIAAAKDRQEGENALADKKGLEAMMVKLQKQMEEGQEELKKLIQEIEASTEMVSRMLAGASDSMMQITANIGKRSTV